MKEFAATGEFVIKSLSMAMRYCHMGVHAGYKQVNLQRDTLAIGRPRSWKEPMLIFATTIWHYVPLQLKKAPEALRDASSDTLNMLTIMKEPDCREQKKPVKLR